MVLMDIEAPQLDSLDEYSRNELKVIYQQLYEGALPNRVSAVYLRSQIALLLQAQQQSIEVDAFQQSIIDQLSRCNNRKPRVNPGTRLIREWHGESHQVEVLEHGYVYLGQQYRSLSEIAGVITGTKWSGPRFFGLNGRPHA